MAHGHPFVVYIQKRPVGSFGDTMNDIRAWLDHDGTPPVSFKASRIGYEIAFATEHEARDFECQFGDLIRPIGLPV